MLVLVLFATLCGALSPLDKLKDQVLQAQPASLSLLQRCLDGQPILMETRDLPADGRANGDPCADDYQCKSHHCECQPTGGKECQATGGGSSPNFPECAHVDALLALDAYCWTPGDAKWRNLGNVPAFAVENVAQLQESTDGRPDGGDADRYGSFLYNNVISTIKGLDISPSVHPQLTLEIWVKRRANANDREWVIGHDNGDFDRAITLHDNRFGGVAGPIGGVTTSPLGYPQLNRWAHVVVTYGTNARTYLNGQVWDEGAAANGPGTPDMTIGGLTNFPGHYVNALISQVRVYARELSAADVAARFTATLPRYEANFVRLSRNDLDRAAYRLGGYTGGGSYLVESGGVQAASAAPSSPPANAIQFYVYSVSPTTENYLRFGQEFHLRTTDGRYLERLNRISTETPSDAPHFSARFDLQLVAEPTQTWKIEHADGPTTGFVPHDAPIGLNIGGLNNDWTKPDNNNRRLITVRPGDISVVVNWYQVDERMHLVRV